MESLTTNASLHVNTGMNDNDFKINYLCNSNVDLVISNDNDKNNNSSDNSGSKNQDINMRAPLPVFERYEFPVLAEDPSSIHRARTDPLACNVNNEAVLIWNDVIIHRRDVCPTNVTSFPETSTIEDVFQELQTTVAEHNGVSSKLSDNGDDNVDGLGKENLKECLNDRRHRQHHHRHHHRHLHQGHEDDVVSRRRLFEQGLDLPYIVELSRSDGDKCKRDGINSFVYNNTSSLVICNKFRCARKNANIYSECVNHPREMSSYNSLHNQLSKIRNRREIGDNDNINLNDKLDDVDCNWRREAMFERTCRDDQNKFKENNCFALSVENGEDIIGMEKSHFEDVSTELPSPLRISSTSSDVLISSEDSNRNQKHESFQIFRDVIEKNGQCMISQTDCRNENSAMKEEASNAHDDSEVFLEDGKEIDTVEERRRHLLRQSHVFRHERKHHRVKIEHRSKSKNKKKHHTSWDEEEAGSWRDDALIIVRCANEECKNASNLGEARKGYKNCHHCLKTYYCSRGCRREDWVRHKEGGSCHGSRVSSACKKVIGHCNTNPEVKAVLSRFALRGYLSHGRGCVMLGFPDLESTDEFMEFGFPMLELNPIYVSAKELSESKMYGNVIEKLLETCRSYKPDVKFVLNVGVGLRFNKEDFLSFSWTHQGNQYCYRNQNHEEMDTFESLGDDPGYGSLSSNLNTSGKSVPFSLSSSPSTPKNKCKHCFVFDNNSQRSPSSRHKAPILQKFIKLKLSPAAHAQQQEREKRWTLEKHFWDDFRTAGPTLILTSIPRRRGPDIDQSESKIRELTFVNIQRKLRERNVNLWQQYPAVHARLIAYVTQGVHFPSQVLFPVDTKTGRTFTCFMMPEAEAELEWMQSHYLLNDLELSKDSLNKSMSKSLSSSMPSLCTQRSRAKPRSFPTLVSQLGSSVDCLKEVTRDSLLSNSFNNFDTFDNNENITDSSGSYHQVTPVITKLDEKLCQGENNSYEVVVNDRDLTRKPDKYELLTVETPTESDLVNPEVVLNTLTLTDNQVTRSDQNEIADNLHQSNPSDIISDGRVTFLEKETEEFHWGTRLEVTPSFYPVRKARNVKLFSRKKPPPHATDSALTKSQKKSRLKPWQLSAVDLELPVTSSLSHSITSPSLSARLLSTSSSAALCPIPYTSTPKTKKPPDFHEIFASTASPGLIPPPSSSPSHNININAGASDTVLCRPPLNSSPPYNNDMKHTTTAYNCRCQEKHLNNTEHVNIANNISDFSQMDDVGNADDVYANRGTEVVKTKEYGFDSCYRNQVVVDEVDQMKRRRKDRESKLCKLSMSSPSSFPPHKSLLHPVIHQNTEYYKWFEDDALRSPPLATSTIDRGNRDRRGVYHQQQLHSPRHSRRKTKNIKNDRPRCDEQHDPRTENILQSADSQTDPVNLNVRYSATFRRKCNTNYFPADFEINQPSSTSEQTCTINSRDDYDDYDSDEQCHNSICLSLKGNSPNSRPYTKNCERFLPPTNHFTQNNIVLVDRDDTVITNNNSLIQSSPVTFSNNDNDDNNNIYNNDDNNNVSNNDNTSNNTRKALTPKKSIRNHSNSNSDLSTFSHHHRNHHHHHQQQQQQQQQQQLDDIETNHDSHLRMPMSFRNDAHQHSANQQNSPLPFSSKHVNNPSSPSSTISSKRKIKFNLPNSDSVASSQSQENNRRSRTKDSHKYSKHYETRHDRPGYSSVKDHRHTISTENRKSNKSSLVTKSHTEPRKGNLHVERRRQHSTCHLIPAINILSYSSDW